MKPGEGRLAECLSKQQDQESKGNVEGTAEVPLILGLPYYLYWLVSTLCLSDLRAHNSVWINPRNMTLEIYVPWDTGKTLTDDCKGELAEFKIELGESINKNLPLGECSAPSSSWPV